MIHKLDDFSELSPLRPLIDGCCGRAGRISSKILR